MSAPFHLDYWRSRLTSALVSGFFAFPPIHFG